MSETNRQAQLDQLARTIETDNVTPELKASATQLVFGTGPATAELVFAGEAPGKNEDLKGEPFIGAAGKFLNEMLAGIGLERKDVYITNIVKYRPPGNRDPTPAEIAAFKPYLLQQIAIIGPKLVIFLGRHSAKVFFPDLVIGEAHGQMLELNGQHYLPLYHPAAALYNGGMRQTLLDDFSKIPAILKQIP